MGAGWPSFAVAVFVWSGILVATGNAGAAFFVGGGVWIGLYIFMRAGAQELIEDRKKAIDDLIKDLSSNEDFNPSHAFVSRSSTAFVAFDGNYVVVGGYKSQSNQQVPDHIKLARQEIRAVELADSGQAIFGSGLGSSLGMAALGAVAFGGAGAVVGAIAGQGAKVATDITLTIWTRNYDVPVVAVNFLDEPQGPVPRESEAYRKTMAEARNWYGRLSIMLEDSSIGNDNED